MKRLGEHRERAVKGKIKGICEILRRWRAPPPKANKMEIMDRVTENYRRDESAF